MHLSACRDNKKKKGTLAHFLTPMKSERQNERACVSDITLLTEERGRGRERGSEGERKRAREN